MFGNLQSVCVYAHVCVCVCLCMWGCVELQPCYLNGHMLFITGLFDDTTPFLFIW